MPKVEIIEKGCRGCAMCINRCPVKVFERTEKSKPGQFMATVSQAENCMGCFACYYICPSQCIKVSEVDIQRPFYRVDENISLVKRFLDVDVTSQDLTLADWQEAYQDVSMTLISLAKAIESAMGRGTGAVGKLAGKLAAPHIPEVFEKQGLSARLEQLQKRFRHSFDFNFEIEGEIIIFTFSPCGLFHVLENAGEKVGEATLCSLFHQFWAGLIGVYSDKNYRFAVTEVGAKCVLHFSPI
jgi:2-oxoglutarate ferredoxin oxidoreductase subunit delta